MRDNAINARIILSVIIIVGVLIYGPGPAYSQQGNIQNLIVNGGFEGGFQEEFGVAYGWGGFSNGNAVVGWNFDDWEAVVVNGKYSQRIEITDAQALNRYAGIYQIIPVVPGQQYKLTIKGLIRSSEGDIAQSDYGYRLQYAIDQKGSTAWELVNESAWNELPWDEQPMTGPPGGAFNIDTYETTITAQSDKLTLFIRGWKKWINQGSGVYNLDEISFVGPAPEGFQAPVAAAASLGQAEEAQPQPEVEAQTQASEADVEPVVEETLPEAAPQSNESVESATSAEAPASSSSAQSQISVQANQAPQQGVSPQPESAELPVSGQGSVDTNYVVILGGSLLLVLVAAAVVATVRWRNAAE